MPQPPQLARSVFGSMHAPLAQRKVENPLQLAWHCGTQKGQSLPHD